MAIPKPQMLIRADAGHGIGVGHLLRCLALAQAWQDAGGRATFLTCCDSEALRRRIAEEGFECLGLDWPHPDPTDLETVRHQARPGDWLVLDGYHFDPEYQSEARQGGVRVLVIDDSAHQRRYIAEAILNQNVLAEELDYVAEPSTLRLLGPSYALLRKEFLPWREGVARRHPVERVLVSLGGGDSFEVSRKVLRVLRGSGLDRLDVRLVVGPMDQDAHRFAAELAAPGVQLVQTPDPQRMPELMAWADLAIAGGGSSCWELAFLGVPMLILSRSANQDRIGAALDSAGAAVHLGSLGVLAEEELSRRIAACCQDVDLLERLSSTGRGLVDGRGAGRVVAALLAAGGAAA